MYMLLVHSQQKHGWKHIFKIIMILFPVGHTVVLCYLDVPAKKETFVAPVVEWALGRYLSAISSFTIT